MTLASALYKSFRRGTDGTGIYDGPMVTLVRNLEDAAKERGYTLSRWQTNSKMDSSIATISYAIHSGPRAAQLRYQNNVVFSTVFDGTEGKTERCRAYKCLNAMYQQLLAM